ncbi:histidine phosphatase family protein [Pseudooceanicola algae]|uniref:phosphoglycerate mutase (2,3-diphosphoglycerate-dependent) n=1 Tax=Pseudooceanicola algae TaxID=1537215 RepID=A0A418SBV0_9RHOB|nr:histidine phosphatase family protein [Pseudooceanicola algae]QPM92527.1 2,3-bisphosphoglycerate-dependent phosphoglycerate mutase [Pseudooceanicola algae]
MAEPSYIVFLRHGDYHQRKGAPSARQPFALTDAGLDQTCEGAQELAAMLADLARPLAPQAYTSRQLRAWQTATGLLERLRAQGHSLDPIKQTSALGERSVGAVANLTIAEIEAVLQADPRYEVPPPGWKSDSAYRLPFEGAESLAEAGARVARHLRDTLRPGQVVLHVGHGASFRHACHQLGVLEKEDIPKLSTFHARPLLLCHEADGRWHHLAGAWKVRIPTEDPTD